MTQDTLHPLGAQLAGLARELRHTHPPAWLPEAIGRRVAPRERPRRIVAAWGFAAMTVACGLGAFGVLGVLSPVADAPGGLQAAQVARDFVQVASAERWQQAAREGAAWLVATELPQARLAALGLPYDPTRAGERVPAQLLMHSSGDVLAVRLIQ